MMPVVLIFLFVAVPWWLTFIIKRQRRIQTETYQEKIRRDEQRSELLDKFRATLKSARNQLDIEEMEKEIVEGKVPTTTAIRVTQRFLELAFPDTLGSPSPDQKLEDYIFRKMEHLHALGDDLSTVFPLLEDSIKNYAKRYARTKTTTQVMKAIEKSLPDEVDSVVKQRLKNSFESLYDQLLTAPIDTVVNRIDGKLAYILTDKSADALQEQYWGWVEFVCDDASKRGKYLGDLVVNEFHTR